MYKIFGGLDKEASADIVIDISSGNTAEIYIEQNGKKYPMTQTDKYVKQNK